MAGYCARRYSGYRSSSCPSSTPFAGMKSKARRVVDQDGDVLDTLVIRHGDRRVVKRFFGRCYNTRRGYPGNSLPTSFDTMRAPTERSSHLLPIKPASMKTAGRKSLTSTPENENARCVYSSQRRKSNDFSASTAQFTTCSELDVIISKRSMIACSGSKLSRTGRRRLVLAEREKVQARFRARTASGALT